jgi:competence protein ComEC
VKNGDFINLDPEVTIQVLNPQNTFFDNPNDNSIVLKMTYGNKSVLFTGDIDTPAENYLVSHGAQLKANVLKVAHHGSDSSSSMAFLTQVSPESSVIEVGTGNDYGHPSPLVLQRLQMVGSEIYRTDLNGDIPIQIYRNGAMGIGPISINLTPTPITTPTTLPTTPITTIPTASPTTIPTTGIPGTGNIVVSDLNLSEEYVIIHNEGTSAVPLTGWNLHDEGSNYNYPFPAIMISPGSSIAIHSHATGTDTATDLYWTLNNVWNNDGDTAYLVDSLGTTVSSLHRSG